MHTDRPELTEYETLAADLSLGVTRLRARLREAGHLLEHGYTLPQLSMLSRIVEEGPMPLTRLADAEHIRPQSAAQTVAILTANGLVTSTSDREDRRRTQVAATLEGEELLSHLRRDREHWLARCIELEFTPEERHGLRMAVGLLDRIARHGKA